MSQVPFVCSKCGSTEFRVTSQPKSYEEMFGVPCAKCGSPLTEDDIKQQALKIAEKAIKDKFKF